MKFPSTVTNTAMDIAILKTRVTEAVIYTQTHTHHSVVGGLRLQNLTTIPAKEIHCHIYTVA
jgi:hypothetical protein